MAVAEDIDWGFVVEVVIGEYAAAVLAIVDVVVAVKYAPGLVVAAVHAVARVVEVVSGLAVVILETVVESVTVAAIDIVVDVEVVEGEVGESIGLDVVAVAEGAEQAALADAGWTVRVERLAEHCVSDSDFVEGVQDDSVQDGKIEDVVSGSAAGSVVADCEEDSHSMDTAAVAEGQAYAQVRKSVVKTMALQMAFPLAF